VIEVRGLRKNYGAFPAVKDLSFSVGKEQVLGFLGPNGAGKTTVMKILTGYHYPSGGEALVDGLSVEEESAAVKRLIGYLPESVPLYGELSVEEYLSFIAAAREIPREERRKALDRSLEACGLLPMRGRRIETLSKGYKQRAGLAQAILHDPPILILDEPTSGLDPNQIIEIRGLIRELGKRKTVILSTHILQEVEAVCSRVLILSEGRIAAQGTPEEIAGTLKGGDTWELLLKAPGGPSMGLAEIREKFARTGGRLGGEPASLSLENREGGVVGASFFIAGGAAGGTGDAAAGERIFDWAVAEGLKILGMTRKKLSLEDIFVKLTTEGKE
jgi:ABC-2 type transport system ATP-binding protein